jgi:hypothetical protein
MGGDGMNTEKPKKQNKVMVNFTLDNMAYVYLKRIKQRECISISAYVNRLILMDAIDKNRPFDKKIV